MENALSTSSVGGHSESIATAALIANGWSVSSPIIPEAYDIVASKYVDGNLTYVRFQVKTIKKRIRDGVEYYVIRGLKNNKKCYNEIDCDYFIGVSGTEVYLTPCRNISEYWTRKDEASEKWERIGLEIS